MQPIKVENRDALKSRVLDRLRGKLHIMPGLNANDFRDEIGSTDPVDFYSVLYDLVRDGIIVPGHPDNLTSRQPWNNSHQNGFPYYSITSYGRRVLSGDDSAVDPHDVAGYLRDARQRLPGGDEGIFRYLAEAVGTFNGCWYLASTIMLGAAAEGLMEWLYDGFIGHLRDPGRTRFAKSFEQTRLKTQKRFDEFKSALQQHHGELPKDLIYQSNAYLEQLSTLIRVNRDDAAHRRADRVDKELVHGNLIVFKTLMSRVAELRTALGAQPCSIP